MADTTETNAAGLGANRRAPLRPEQRAAIQALRENDDDASDFWVDPDKIPDGMTYEWKRLDQGFGKADPKYVARMERMGWRPVPAHRHPELFGRVADKDTPAVYGGMMLMERPVELTKDARAFEYKKARRNVKDQSDRLGLSTQTLMPRVRPKGKNSQSYEPVDIPGDSE